MPHIKSIGSENISVAAGAFDAPTGMPSIPPSGMEKLSGGTALTRTPMAAESAFSFARASPGRLKVSTVA